MGVYKQVSKIEALLEKEIGEDNIPYLNFTIYIKALPKSWRTILNGWGIKDDDIFFGVNTEFNGNRYDLVCLGPPYKKEKYTDYLNKNDEGPGWYAYRYDDTNKDKKNYLSNKIEFLYQQLQQFFKFMRLYEKQCKQLEQMLDLNQDTLDTTTE